jgi:hypothetical protein
MMNAPFQLAKLLDTDKTTKERYQESMQDPKSFVQGLKSLYIPIEAIGEGLEFLFNPQDIKETRLKLATGEAEPMERIAAQVGSTLELLGAGELFKIIGRRFGPDVLDSLQKQNLQSNIQIINALPISGKEKVDFAKEIYGGSGLPQKPPTMQTSQILSAPADTGGSGLSGQALATKVRTENLQQRLYEPYRDIYTSYTNQTDNPSARGFLNFLKDKKFPLTKGISQDPRDTSDIRHIEKAVNFLTKGKATLGAFKKPWELRTEEILKNSDRQLLNIEVKRKLAEEGFNIPLTSIGNFVKGKKIDIDAAKNIVPESGLVANRKLILSELEKLRDDLVANPEKQGMGLKQYSIETPAMKQGSRTIESIIKDYRDKLKTQTTQENITDIVPASLIDEIENLVKVKKGGPDIVDENLFRFYIPEPTKQAGNVYQQNLQFLKDLYRPGGLGVFKDFEELANAYGIKKVLPDDPDAISLRAENRDLINKLADDVQLLLTSTKDGKKAINKNQLAAYRQVIDESLALTDYNKNKFIETLNKSPELKDQLINQYTKYYNDKVNFDPKLKKLSPEKKQEYLNKKLTEKNIIDMGMKAFEGHVSHIFRIEKFRDANKGMEFMGGIGNTVRSNLGIENFALQPKAENVVTNAVKFIKKGIKNNDQQKIDEGLNAILYFQKLLNRKGMGAYIRIDKKDLTPEVIERINNFLIDGDYSIGIKSERAGTISKEGAPDKISEKFNDIFIGSEKPLTLEQNQMRFDQLMNFYLANPDRLIVTPPSSLPRKEPKLIEGVLETPYRRAGFINTDLVDIEAETQFKKGGAVRMAIGGDPLQNINQQQFAPDPAMDDDFFKKAIDSGNLQAFGAGNLFKIFGKVPGLLTPKKVVSDIPTAPGTTPMVPNVDPGDFPFKSYFIESTTNPKAPKSALPKDWLKYYTGNIGVPQSEMKDAGIFNYLEDIEKFFPNTKLTQQNLIDVYESSPIANIEVKIKRQPSTNTPPGSLGAYMGKPTHQGSGSQPLDSQGTNYREIVVNVDKLPGQDKPFFNASHFGKDPNVIAFTRVADYKDVDGNTVAAIQEIQTDMLTNLKKEQERMKATAVMIRNYKEKLKNQIAQGDTYMQDMLEKTERDYPESMLRFMETSDLVRPNNPTFADTLTPDVVKELTEIQERITNIANQNRVTVVDPDFQNKIVALQEEGRQKFNKLFELNRGTNYEDQLKNIKILDVDNTDDLERFANANPSYEARFRPVQSFPVLPFNKGKDYIDLLLKATIQDARANGINKVAIYPSELVNKRWGKDPDGPAAKKFKTIYDNITVQEMKNIAKKYTGSKNNLKIEEIVDKSKADKGLKFYNKNVDGELELLKDFEPRAGNSSDEVQDFLDAEIERVASDFGSNEVVIRREIAPGQTMEYYVQLEGDDGFKLVPLGDADRAENATVIIDEYNPQRVKMFTLTLPEETTKKGPMFIYGKKDGGKIASDGLVSITDIFGEY